MTRRKSRPCLFASATAGLEVLRVRAFFHLLPERPALQALTWAGFCAKQFLGSELELVRKASKVIGDEQIHFSSYSGITFRRGITSLAVHNLEQLIPANRELYHDDLFAAVAASASVIISQYRGVGNVIATMRREEVSEATAANNWPVILMLAKAGGYNPSELRGAKYGYLPAGILGGVRDSSETVASWALLPPADNAVMPGSLHFNLTLDGITVYTGMFASEKVEGAE